MRTIILASFGLLTACGGTTAPSPSDMVVSVEQPLSACPTTLAATNGHSCATEGMRCTVPIMCTTTYQQVRCSCEKGVFSCADSIGPLLPADTPRCESGPKDDMSACPPSEGVAEGAMCHEVGRSCAYPGAECPNLPVRLTDYCQCKRDPADGTMTFRCARAACPPQ
jgi:hypothetical protein